MSEEQAEDHVDLMDPVEDETPPNYVAARVVRDLTGQVGHEIVNDTATGNYVSKCSNVFYKERAKVTENDLVSCPGCKTADLPRIVRQPVQRTKIAKARKISNNPRWRTAKDAVDGVEENLKHALKAVTAAQEWSVRGVRGQFMQQALDQTHMAYRFLGEILQQAEMIPRPDDVETEADE